MESLKIRISIKDIRKYIVNPDTQFENPYDSEEELKNDSEPEEGLANEESDGDGGNSESTDTDNDSEDDDVSWKKVQEEEKQKTDHYVKYKLKDVSVVLERDEKIDLLGRKMFANIGECENSYNSSMLSLSSDINGPKGEEFFVDGDNMVEDGGIMCTDLMEVVLNEGDADEILERPEDSEMPPQEDEPTYDEEDFVAEFGEGLLIDVDVEKEEEENRYLDSICIIDINNIHALEVEEVPVKKKRKRRGRCAKVSSADIDGDDKPKAQGGENLDGQDREKEEVPKIPRKFIPRRNLMKHNVVYYDEKSEHFACRYCEYKAKTKKPVIMHVTMKHHRKSGALRMPKFKKPMGVKKHRQMYECLHCPFTSRSRMIYKSHMRAEHNADAELIICPLCDFQARRKDNLMRHMRVRHEDGTELFQCESCDFQAYNKFKLKDHIKQAHSKKKREFTCRDCEFVTQTRSLLSAHIKSEHEQQSYQCDQCGYQTRFRYMLKRHIQRVHEGPSCYQCNVCEYTTNRMDSLKRHFIVRHEELIDVEVLTCPICNYQTKVRSYLSKHIRTVHRKEQGPLRCSLCDFQTPNKTEMEEHKTQVHNKVGKFYQCQYCEYRTDKKSRMPKHMQARHGQEPTEVFKCVLCDYDARFLDHITKHMKKKHAWY